MDAVSENWGSIHVSHFTQESLFISKAKLSVCLELTNKNVPQLLLYGRCQHDQQATCVPWNLRRDRPPASQTGVVSGGSAGVMGRNPLRHSACIASCLNSTLIFAECFPVPVLLLIGSLTTLGNTQSGSRHSHPHLADEIQG